MTFRQEIPMVFLHDVLVSELNLISIFYDSISSNAIFILDHGIDQFI